MTLIATGCVMASLGGTPDPTSASIGPGSKLPFAWSNADFSKTTPTGTDAITLLLQLLLSQTGDGTNDATYDVFEANVGLGIPSGMINKASFTNILNSADWDSAAQYFFALAQAEDAKKFIEEQICKPLGLYLSVNNAGLITCNRPKHPQKFYIGGTNQVFPFNAPAGSTNGPYLAVLPIGVYDGPTLATALQNTLNAVAGGGVTPTGWKGGAVIPAYGGLSSPDTFGASKATGWTVSYNTSTHKFTVANASSTFDLVGLVGGNPAGNLAWQTMGFTTWPGHTGVAAGATGTSSDLAVGAFGGAMPLAGGGTYSPGAVTLNQGDVTDIAEVVNQDLQITRVIYEYDYDWDRDKFTMAKMISDAEAVNLGDVLGSHDYRIQTKGLVSGAFPHTVPHWTWWVPPGALGTLAGGCGPQSVKPATPNISSFAVEADTWALLYALMLLDRYRYPPLRFKCKALLSAGKDTSANVNTAAGTRIEVGDSVQFTYNIASVVADRELAGSTMSNRVFEVIAKSDNWKAGYVELELLGYSGNITY